MKVAGDHVILAGLNEVMRPALIAANDIWLGHGEELVVTCGLNGVHSARSLHYYGKALDFRCRYFAPNVQVVVAHELRDSLPDAFDVVFEGDHIHVEYDPKDGES